MGRRSRKRGISERSSISPAGTSRAERDAARERRAERLRGGDGGRSPAGRPSRRPGARPTTDERPPAPWGSFPLVELAVLLAIVMFVLGFVVGGVRGRILLTGALALGSLAGLELSIREHFAGYRSHTTLLAGVAAFVSVVVSYFALGRGNLARALLVPIAGAVFMVSFWLLRQAFKRRSGGLGFR